MNDTPPPEPPSTDRPSSAQPKKTVSFPLPAPHHAAQSPTQAKILARKPTPFNTDLAASIRHSGLSLGASDEPEQMALDQDDDDNDLDFGEELEEQPVDADTALMAKQMSAAHAQHSPPPPLQPSESAHHAPEPHTPQQTPPVQQRQSLPPQL